jgi:hypothetical protein
MYQLNDGRQPCARCGHTHWTRETINRQRLLRCLACGARAQFTLPPQPATKSTQRGGSRAWLPGMDTGHPVERTTR